MGSCFPFPSNSLHLTHLESSVGIQRAEAGGAARAGQGWAAAYGSSAPGLYNERHSQNSWGFLPSTSFSAFPWLKSIPTAGHHTLAGILVCEESSVSMVPSSSLSLSPFPLHCASQEVPKMLGDFHQAVRNAKHKSFMYLTLIKRKPTSPSAAL